jgi:hypothetical protein
MAPPEPSLPVPSKGPGDPVPQLGTQSVRNLILQNIEDYMNARSNTKKYHTLEGLISFCTDYIADKEVRNKVRLQMTEKILNPETDFLNAYKNQSRVVPWDIILENEYRKLLPELRDVWFVVHQELVNQGLIPWLLPDPARDLRDRMLRKVIEAIDKEAKKKEGDSWTVKATVSPVEEVREVSTEKRLDLLMDEQRKLLEGDGGKDSEDEPDYEDELLPPHEDEDNPEPVSDEELDEAERILKNFYQKRRGKTE